MPSYATVYSRTQVGITAPLVTVETHISNGLPKFSIVGLPETVVKESKDRVRSAILNSQFEFPDRCITVNLAPADMPKTGGRFDLPIAISILMATKQLPLKDTGQYEFAGELALSGELRAIQGSLSMAIGAAESQRHLFLPQKNCLEASLIKSIQLLPANHLLDVCAHLTTKSRITPYVPPSVKTAVQSSHDISDICGQTQAKRALIIAAAGGHSVLMVGAPGSGKTMLASRVPGILPPLTEQEALETAMIKSLAQQAICPSTWHQPPFRSPHHTASAVALVGGGTNPRPGEISLAHNGVLFLDEVAEFHRHVLESLREPLESGCIHIARAKAQQNYPARFQLIAAMNPCPCGYHGDASQDCHCTAEQIQRYHMRLSGPFLDRIDLFVHVPRLPTRLLMQQTSQDKISSVEIKQQVIEARQRQMKRGQLVNAKLSAHRLQAEDYISPTLVNWLEKMTERMNLSARAYHRILRVARTIADLAQSDQIDESHVSEALLYRQPKVRLE